MERPTLIRGWSPLVEGFVAGKFNLVHFLKPTPVWMRYNNKIPVKLTAWAHTNGSGLVVGGYTGIEDFSQLGGKQVAVPFWYSMHNFWYSMHNIVLQYALRQSGIKPVIKSATEPLAADECNLQILPPPEMPAALAVQKIDAYIVDEPPGLLGDDTAPNPSEASLAALGSCIAVGLHANAIHRGITINSLGLELEGDLNITAVWGTGDVSEKPVGFTDVRIIVHMDADASQETIDELITHVTQWLPVFNTFSRPVNMVAQSA
ncbi:OsmC family protein [Breoghania sp.]|uniref:OsmC family protein n=1 Tax=Breoghania sp. TaxID=2065378 RepID=UPI00262FD3AE|nr:OsmC family protein [Breoghania sp.]MDJ0932971.1 OsmC family protein [Breoghania sp.]